MNHRSRRGVLAPGHRRAVEIALGVDVVVDVVDPQLDRLVEHGDSVVDARPAVAAQRDLRDREPGLAQSAVAHSGMEIEDLRRIGGRALPGARTAHRSSGHDAGRGLEEISSRIARIHHRITPQLDSVGETAWARRRRTAVDQGCLALGPAPIDGTPIRLVSCFIRAHAGSQVKHQESGSPSAPPWNRPSETNTLEWGEVAPSPQGLP